MASDDRKQLALEFLEVLSTRDADKILERMTPEPTWVFIAQRFPGQEGVRAIVKASAELYQPGTTERDTHAVYADGDTVIVRSSMRATTFKGEAYENHYVMFVHLEGDKVDCVEEWLDTAYANEKFSGWEMSDT